MIQMVRLSRRFLVVACLLLPLTVGNKATSEDNNNNNKVSLLIEAYMCEEVENMLCKEPAVVFSVEKRQVFCYTRFGNVPETMIVYHRWYYRGDLSTQIRLKVRKSEPVVFSSIQLREADKGPWQVEIVGDDGHVYKVLRFSITD